MSPTNATAPFGNAATIVAALIALAIVVVAPVAVVVVTVEDGRADIEPQLSAPLAQLKQHTVTCATTATALHPGGAERASSFLVINSSTTAVRVGDEGVTSSTGADVCDGCNIGKTFSFDARKAWCIVASGTQAVEVVYGAN